MKREQYISVDLDYWGMLATDRDQSANICIDFLNKFDIEFVCDSHEEMLQHLNKFSVNRLTNIDYHSDIMRMIDLPRVPFQDGNWANYYIFRESCIFEWRYPDDESKHHGRCDGLRVDQNNKWNYRNSFGYKDAIYRKGIPKKLINKISIAKSPAYCTEEFNEKLDTYLKNRL
jgi:hypothetical protein